MSTIQDTLTSQVQIATTAVNSANLRFLDSVVDVNRNAVDFAVKSAERLPQITLPSQVPFGDALPTAAETGDRYLDVVERAVSANRDLSDRIVKMLPADIAPKAATKPAKKATKSGAK